jgi:F0F1-type ATP synthase membrane subunit b/b'
MAIFKSHEARRQAALQRRTAALAEARARAQAEIKNARSGIEQEKQKAQAVLQAEAQSLAKEIIRTVFEAAGGQPETGAGQ